MITNLWLLSLFFLANILIALSFLSYAWIYIDAYITAKRNKDAFRGIGGVLLSLYFIVNILTVNTQMSGAGVLGLLFCLTFGLFSIFYGNLLEPVPGLPEDTIGRKLKAGNYLVLFIFFSISVALAILNATSFSRISIILNFLLFVGIIVYILVFYRKFLEPNTDLNNEEHFRKQRTLSLILVILPFFTSSLISILIAIQNYKKVVEGLSKEFRYLAIFWGVFSGFSIIQILTLLGQFYFVSIDVWTRQYSFLWILSQIILIICALLMLKWITMFLSFRIVARLFLYIWQISIFLTVVVALSYSIFIISSSESQVSDLLTKNANLIEFNLEQIKSNNVDMLNILGKDKKLISAITGNDASAIQDEIGNFVSSNSFLDKVQVVSPTGLLVYDSEAPTDEGTNLSDNIILAKTINTKTPYASFIAEQSGIDTSTLDYQFTYPVRDPAGKLFGVITSIKRLNDNYLDLLKKQTSQELVIYVNGKRASSTILESDNLSRLKNLPLVLDGLISASGDIYFYKGRILTTPYYLAIINLNDVNNKTISSLIIATKQSVLIDITEHSLFNLFLLSLFLTLVSTIPSYFLAQSLKRNLSA